MRPSGSGVAWPGAGRLADTDPAAVPRTAYLDRVLTRITFPGALFLGAIVLLPTAIYNGIGVKVYFGGTSLLIVVGVALDTMRQMEAQLLMRHYEGFLK